MEGKNSESAATRKAGSSKAGWTALRRFVKGKSASGSNMRFNPFQLFSVRPTGIVDGPPGSGEVYRVEEYCHHSTGTKVVLQRRCELNTTVADVQLAQKENIDNTGNFHWPAEEILTHLLLTRSYPTLLSPSSTQTLPRPRILELGAGFGLASFCAAKAKIGHFIATDGNSGVVANLERNIGTMADGDTTDDECNCEAGLVRWDGRGSYEGYLGTVDAIVGADCLFFEKFHNDLSDLVMTFLSSSTAVCKATERSCAAYRPLREIVFVAPSRGKSLERWVELLTSRLESKGLLKGSKADSSSTTNTNDSCGCTGSSWRVSIEVKREYDQHISAVHQRYADSRNPAVEVEASSSSGKAGRDEDGGEYQPDRHYPLLVHILRCDL